MTGCFSSRESGNGNSSDGLVCCEVVPGGGRGGAAAAVPTIKWTAIEAAALVALVMGTCATVSEAF